MTQNQLKILSILSLTLLAISVFGIITIIAFGSVVFFGYLYLQKVVRKHTERGLIELLPRRVQDSLLHRSLFELICQSWLYEAFKFLKLITKPVLDPHDPDNAIQAFEGVNSSDKNKYLAKGIFRIMPNSCQRILLGKQRFQRLENDQIFQEYQPKHLKERDSQKNTDDQSQKSIRRGMNAEVAQVILWKEEVQVNREIMQRQICPRQEALVQNQIESYDIKPNFAIAKRRFFKMARNSIAMLKNLIQVQTLGYRIQKMSTGTIIKLAILFWIVLIAQMKFNKDTRRIVLKTGYVIGGIISILGTVATTGALMYKQCSKDRKNAIKMQK